VASERSQPFATLIFDGDCGFCTSAANFVVKHSSYPIVAHAWQLTDVTRFGLTEAQVAERVYFAIDGQNYGGHLAFAYILFVQKNWLLKAAGWIMTVPPVCWVASIGYRLVARFRHRLPGGTPACKLPPAV
jgi:predicted DCC family thiol-disulfide oxidoreductase YuxK